MMRTKSLLLATATALAGMAGGAALPATAAPSVATDIPPVHALAARVMQGVGEPGLILPPGASPHAYSMKPSEAQLVQEADIVFWVGEELTPWLDRAVDALADDAASIQLLDAPDVVHLGYREGVTFEPHDHDDEHGHDESTATTRRTTRTRTTITTMPTRRPRRTRITIMTRWPRRVTITTTARARPRRTTTTTRASIRTPGSTR